MKITSLKPTNFVKQLPLVLALALTACSPTITPKKTVDPTNPDGSKPDVSLGINIRSEVTRGTEACLGAIEGNFSTLQSLPQAGYKSIERNDARNIYYKKIPRILYQKDGINRQRFAITDSPKKGFCIFVTENLGSRAPKDVHAQILKQINASGYNIVGTDGKKIIHQKGNKQFKSLMTLNFTGDSNGRYQWRFFR